jgi:DNA replication and repair protein RecF
MKNIAIEELALFNYRNFEQLKLDFQPGVNMIIGLNGVGKTNILESISLLAPGRGLRGAAFDEMCRSNCNNWSSSFTLQSKLAIAKIENHFTVSNTRKRNILYNGAKISSGELPNLLNILWLTPQMEDFFLTSASIRRKFIDRLVYNFAPEHAHNINLYDHLLKERMQTITDSIKKPSRSAVGNNPWLDNIEQRIADIAYVITTWRHKVVSYMQQALDDIAMDFPKGNISLCGLDVSAELEKEIFIAQYLSKLASFREKDGYSGRSNFGVHKTDIHVVHKQKNQVARCCSTGEQKALLISLMLSAIEIILYHNQASPIILLDEIFIHLDDVKKTQLADYLTSIKMQTFVTANDILGVEKFAASANLINI